MKRQCGSCTKCCEGWLTTEVLGHKIYPGRPCHFVSIDKGCTVYSQRPKDPCVSFKCSWLENTNIPEWMKPSEINAIIKQDTIDDIDFISIVEAGETLQSRVLSWIIQYAINNRLNLVWRINGHPNWIGSPEFHQAMESDPPKDKSLDSKPRYLLPVVEVE